MDFHLLSLNSYTFGVILSTFTHTGNKFNHLLFIFTSFLILPTNCIPSRQRVAMQQLLNTNQHIRQGGEEFLQWLPVIIRSDTKKFMKKTFSLYLICSVCVLNLPGTIYKENMSEEIEELRDQIGRKLDIFILTSSTLSPLAPAICNLIVNLTNTPPCKTKEGQVDSNSSAF